MPSKETINGYIGQRFGRLVVQSFSRLDARDPDKHWFVNCLCDCGKTKEIRMAALQTNNKKHRGTKSCGCLHSDVASEIHRGNQYMRKPPGENAKNSIYNNYIGGARRRGLEFNLSQEDFYRLIQMNCFYCDSPPSNVKKPRHGNGAFIYSGVDRIDNNRGYSPDNCVACCIKCNFKKNKIELDLVKKIYFLAKERGLTD